MFFQLYNAVRCYFVVNHWTWQNMVLMFSFQSCMTIRDRRCTRVDRVKEDFDTFKYILRIGDPYIYFTFYWMILHEKVGTKTPEFDIISPLCIFDLKQPVNESAKFLSWLILVPASPVDAESGDQPGGGRKPEEDHGRKSANTKVTQARQGGPNFVIARRTQKVRKSNQWRHWFQIFWNLNVFNSSPTFLSF